MKINLNRFLLLSSLMFIFRWPLSSQEAFTMQKQWGEFGDKPGQFKYPAMIASDQYSNVYVVDQHNHRIQKFDSDGNFILMWGKQGYAPGEFYFPYGIAISSDGAVFVSDMNNHRIQKFSPGGTFIVTAGEYGTGDGQLKYPYGIAVDEKDILYVIDAFNYRIQQFDKNLKFLSKWGSQESIGFRLYAPHEIAVAGDGNIVLSDRQNHRISVFTKEGALVKRFGLFGEGKDLRGGLFSEPHGVSISKKGEIFVCDRYNFKVQQFSAAGEFIQQWITPGIPDDSRHFPLGITAAGNGKVYVTDHFAHCVQVF
jgi:DNA-binding beta-propeller fold protein YncE